MLQSCYVLLCCHFISVGPFEYTKMCGKVLFSFRRRRNIYTSGKTHYVKVIIAILLFWLYWYLTVFYSQFLSSSSYLQHIHILNLFYLSMRIHVYLGYTCLRSVLCAWRISSLHIKDASISSCGGTRLSVLRMGNASLGLHYFYACLRIRRYSGMIMMNNFISFMNENIMFLIIHIVAINTYTAHA